MLKSAHIPLLVIQDLPSPSGMLDVVASSARTLQESLWFLKQHHEAENGRDSVSQLEPFAPGRNSLASTCWKVGLKASTLRAVDVKASLLGVVSMGGLIATATQAALSPRVSESLCMLVRLQVYFI